MATSHPRGEREIQRAAIAIPPNIRYILRIMRSPRIRAFYYLWPGTANNHAGMGYFAKCLQKNLGFPFFCFCNLPKDYPKPVDLAKYYAYFTSPWTDGLFLMEYLSPIGNANQEELVLNLRKRKVHQPMVGLVHLPEGLLLKYWTMDHIRSALDLIDHIVVYGSSLAKFLDRLGYGAKLKQTFHYVDTDYYHPKEKPLTDQPLKVIVFGMLLRNTPVLKQIVLQCPQVNFHICAGMADLKSTFQGLPNVVLHEYMPEPELLNKLQEADASLSVLEDTVGSNSIVAGLACGLPQIVSDVGSIRDYCSKENSFFCQDPDDYVKAIRFLSQNKDACQNMGKNARQRAEELSLPKSIQWFKNFFQTIL